ncbi:MAG: hypothetical protein UV80_C0015G0002 [Candidatus Peregrinibacteria bacterium GW2011_GWF2_43_17]|nr:MAG: hypothetical protein UV80_C0015G0002 [Candidatus Peregrinibacteria bacterium GW2011_GWF2_43_17]KKT19943.1 MAG: hypothetical protein UW03_C0012G0012 [Candidatus Peregrinibacteria bacterium GW2011_GWA2_43_8]HAU40137.1 SAM-dependent methyltransferase [Candidatus Peregrinibacteria bacterium]
MLKSQIFALSSIEIAILIALTIPTLWALFSAPFVPTPMKAVRKMLKLANIKEGDKIYDLGCGDGRLVHAASKEYKANAVGFELSPLIFAIAKFLQPFWRSKAKIKFRNFHSQDISDANVVVCYLMPGTLQKMLDKFKTLKKGTRIISYSFKIPGLKLIHEEPRIREQNICPIWVYEI